jgi:hypothetical protein
MVSLWLDPSSKRAARTFVVPSQIGRTWLSRSNTGAGVRTTAPPKAEHFAGNHPQPAYPWSFHYWAQSQQQRIRFIDLLVSLLPVSSAKKASEGSFRFCLHPASIEVQRFSKVRGYSLRNIRGQRQAAAHESNGTNRSTSE